MAGPALLIAIDALTKALQLVGNQVKAAFDFADKAQKSSLALGKTFEQSRKELGGTMQGLRGDISQKFGAAIAGMEEGLQGNTAGIARLINQQQLTGTGFANTAKTMAKLESTLGLSRDQTNVLSNSLISTSQRWSISTDKLVESIDALAATFPAQDLAGMGDKVVGAMTELQGELGPQMAGPLNSVMKSIMDTSLEGYANLQKMGIGDIRERLSAAKNQQEALMILREGIQRAAGTVGVLAGGADKFFGQIGIAQKVMGGAALDFATVAKNFGKRTENEGDQAKDFGKTLENLKNEILAPFHDFMASKFYPIFIEVSDALSAVSTAVVKGFSEWFDKVIPDGKKSFQDISLLIVDTVAGWINKIGYFLDDLEKGLMKVQNVFHFAVVIPLELFSIYLSYVLFPLKRLWLVITAVSTAIAGIIEGIGKMIGFEMEAVSEFRKAAWEKTKDAGMSIVDDVKGVGTSLKTIFTTPEMAKKEQAERLKKAYDDPNALATRMGLKGIRDDIAAGNLIRREGNSSLEEAKNRLGSIDGKTVDPTSKKNSFNSETANSISMTLERVLGIKSNSKAGDILEVSQKKNAESIENIRKIITDSKSLQENSQILSQAVKGKQEQNLALINKMAENTVRQTSELANTMKTTIEVQSVGLEALQAKMAESNDIQLNQLSIQQDSAAFLAMANKQRERQQGNTLNAMKNRGGDAL